MMLLLFNGFLNKNRNKIFLKIFQKLIQIIIEKINILGKFKRNIMKKLYQIYRMNPKIYKKLKLKI